MSAKIDILFTDQEVKDRTCELGKQISEDYYDSDLTLVCILKGGVVFFADLIRTISKTDIRCEFIQAVSYHNTKHEQGIVYSSSLVFSPEDNILIVEDIIDSGKTLPIIIDYIRGCGACVSRIKVCSLMISSGVYEGLCEYVGFRLQDPGWIVGYGLDSVGNYRNLPYIGVLKERD